jgi:hypothetical protein
MSSSRMLRRVALVRTGASEELSASETSVITGATRRNIPEDAILHITVPFSAGAMNCCVPQGDPDPP